LIILFDLILNSREIIKNLVKIRERDKERKSLKGKKKKIKKKKKKKIIKIKIIKKKKKKRINFLFYTMKLLNLTSILVFLSF
jgi:hypothetical protein